MRLVQPFFATTALPAFLSAPAHPSAPRILSSSTATFATPAISSGQSKRPFPSLLAQSHSPLPSIESAFTRVRPALQNTKLSAHRILLQPAANQSIEPVESLPKISRPNCQIHPARPCAQAQHRAASLTMPASTRTSRSSKPPSTSSHAPSSNRIRYRPCSAMARVLIFRKTRFSGPPPLP